MIISGELTAGEALPSIRGLAKSLHISVLTVQKAYDVLQTDGFIETTAGKGCFVSAQNQDFYLEEQQKKIENHFTEAILEMLFEILCQLHHQLCIDLKIGRASCRERV